MRAAGASGWAVCPSVAVADRAECGLMAEVVALRKPPPASRPAKPWPPLRLLPEVRDRTFLPAALEIIETPASPVRIALMLTICGLAAAGIAWTCLGTIDIHATARGKIEPAGHVKVVQPLQPGVVAAVPVMEGQRVAAGEVLLRLDSREAESDLEAASFGRTAAEAEALRRQAEIWAVRAGTPVTPPAIAWPASIPSATALREAAVLVQDLGQLAATLANLDDQGREKEAAVAQLDRSIEAETALLKPLAERVALRQTLVAEGNNSRLSLLDAEQTLLETRAQLIGDMGRRDAAQAAIATIRSERWRTVEAFLADDVQHLADARKTVDEKTDEQVKDQIRLEQLTLRAPVGGRVQSLTVTNPGQVVTTGQEVMRVVPADASLEVLAYVTNDDIGFVKPGQRAVIKVDSFPFTRFGTIEAEVGTVAYDALPAEQANHAVMDAARANGETPIVPTATPLTDLVFEARIKPKALAIAMEGTAIPLSPGMTVTVEIKTGTRLVISYLVGSLSDRFENAMHER